MVETIVTLIRLASDTGQTLVCFICISACSSICNQSILLHPSQAYCLPITTYLEIWNVGKQESAPMIAISQKSPHSCGSQML